MVLQKYNIGKATKEILSIIDKAISRDEEISSGLRINYHRIIPSKKLYNRKKYKVEF